MSASVADLYRLRATSSAELAGIFEALEARVHDAAASIHPDQILQQLQGGGSAETVISTVQQRLEHMLVVLSREGLENILAWRVRAIAAAGGFDWSKVAGAPEGGPEQRLPEALYPAEPELESALQFPRKQPPLIDARSAGTGLNPLVVGVLSGAAVTAAMVLTPWTRTLGLILPVGIASGVLGAIIASSGLGGPARPSPEKVRFALATFVDELSISLRSDLNRIHRSIDDQVKDRFDAVERRLKAG